MGDIIHTLPAVTALRQAFPEAILGWVVEECWAELLCTLPEPRSGPLSARRPLVDCVHTVNTKAWRASPFSAQTFEQIAAGLSELRAQRYEVAVDFQGAVRSALIARWSGAPVVYGFAQPRENVASMFYYASGSCAREPHCRAESCARGGGRTSPHCSCRTSNSRTILRSKIRCEERWGRNFGDFAVTESRARAGGPKDGRQNAMGM